MPNAKHAMEALAKLRKGSGEVVAARLNSGENFSASSWVELCPTLLTENGGLIWVLYEEKADEE